MLNLLFKDTTHTSLLTALEQLEHDTHLPHTMQSHESDPIWSIANYRSNHIDTNTDLSKLLNNIIIQSNTNNSFRAPITRFYGINSGKSSFQKSLNDYAYKNLNVSDKLGRIKFQTKCDWEANVDIVNDHFSDSMPTVYDFTWSKKIYLSTYNRTHHISALYRQSKEQGRIYYIETDRYEQWSLNTGLKTDPTKIYFLAKDLITLPCNPKFRLIYLKDIGLPRSPLHFYEISGLSQKQLQKVNPFILQLQNNNKLITLKKLLKNHSLVY